MTVTAVTSASVGTKLATTTDTKITGLTIATPSSMADARTPLVLVDAAAAPTATSSPPKALYAADLNTLAPIIFAYRPGPSAPPGVTAPTSPWNLGGGGNFTNGVFVVSCPANATFSLTTG